MKFVMAAFVIWRIGLFVIAYFASRILLFKQSFPYWDTILVPSKLPDWLWAWGNFDGVHYLTIAQKGYDGFGTQVFFPLYPILISIFSKVTGNNLVSGLLVSNAAIFMGATLLYKFVEKQFNTKTAKWSVTFLFAFPTSFFFGSVYPESLLLLLILLAFTTKGIWAGVFAGLASGTKLVGVFLAPVLTPKNFWALLGVSGILLYMVHLWSKFSNPFIFLSAQSAFQNNRASEIASLVLPPQVIFRYLKIFLTANIYHFDFWVAQIEFIAFFLGFFILFILVKKNILPKNILVFSWLALILPTFSGTLSSMPRYLLPLFPIYIFFATVKNVWLKLSILLSSVLVLILLSALFTRGYFVA